MEYQPLSNEEDMNDVTTNKASTKKIWYKIGSWRVDPKVLRKALQKFLFLLCSNFVA